MGEVLTGHTTPARQFQQIESVLLHGRGSRDHIEAGLANLDTIQSESAEILQERLKAVNGQPVFGVPVERCAGATRKRAKPGPRRVVIVVFDVRLYDLRHTSGSRVAMAGVDLPR